MLCSLLMFPLTRSLGFHSRRRQPTVPFKIARDRSIVTAPCCAKTSPSTRFVTTANAAGRKARAFNHHGVSLKY